MDPWPEDGSAKWRPSPVAAAAPTGRNLPRAAAGRGQSRRQPKLWLMLAVGVGISACGGPRMAEPIGSRATINIADAALAVGLYDVALNVSHAILARHPNDTAALATRGDALLGSGDTAGAGRAYRSLLAIDPNALRGLIGLGRITVHADPAGAEALFVRALHQDPRSVIAHNNLGVARDLQGRHTDAQLAYQQALGLDPGNKGATVNLALSLALSGDPHAAVGMLQPMAQEPGASDVIRADLGLAMALAGDRGGAARLLADQGEDGTAASPANETSVAVPLSMVRAVLGAPAGEIAANPESEAAKPRAITAAVPEPAAAKPMVIAAGDPPASSRIGGAAPAVSDSIGAPETFSLPPFTEVSLPLPSESLPVVSSLPAASSPPVVSSLPAASSLPVVASLSAVSSLPVVPSLVTASRPAVALPTVSVPAGSPPAMALPTASLTTVQPGPTIMRASAAHQPVTTLGLLTSQLNGARVEKTAFLPANGAGDALQHAIAMVTASAAVPALPRLSERIASIPAVDARVASPPSSPVIPPAPVRASVTTEDAAQGSGVHGLVPVVQVASLNSRPAAYAAWEHFRARFPELFRDRAPLIQPAEVDGHTFWRLRADGFASISAAKAFCSHASARVTGCWAVLAARAGG